jgi:hypothetical protein
MLTDSEKQAIETFVTYRLFNQLWETRRISEATLAEFGNNPNEHQLDIIKYYEGKRFEIRAKTAEFLSKRLFGFDISI